MKLFEMKLDEEAIANGVSAISLVESPAIESDFIALKKEDIAKIEFATVDQEKRIVMGAVLIPEKPILRLDEQGEPFHIFFAKETIRKASELYLQRGLQSSATLEHEINIQGITLVESWIVEDKNLDKSQLYKLDAPVGSWVVSMKVANDEIWNGYVKNGKVKGFSIEGFFTPEEQTKAKLSMKIKKVL